MNISLSETFSKVVKKYPASEWQVVSQTFVYRNGRHEITYILEHPELKYNLIVSRCRYPSNNYEYEIEGCRLNNFKSEELERLVELYACNLVSMQAKAEVEALNRVKNLLLNSLIEKP